MYLDSENGKEKCPISGAESGIWCDASVFLCKLGRDYTSLCGDLRDDRNVGACMYRMCVSDLERKIRNNLAYGSAPRSHGLPCGVELRGRMRYHCQNHA